MLKSADFGSGMPTGAGTQSSIRTRVVSICLDHGLRRDDDGGKTGKLAQSFWPSVVSLAFSSR